MPRPGVLGLITLVLTGVALPVLAWPVLALAWVAIVFDARLAVVFVPVAAARCAFIAAGLTAACVCLAVAMPDRVLPWFAPMSSEDPWGCTRLT